MAEQKTKPTKVSVTSFLDSVQDDQKRKDCYVLLDMMGKITKEKPVMWGPSIVGFGTYHYEYDSGCKGDCCLTGFSPRKDALTLYVMSGFDQHPELMKALGKHKTGKSCLYIKRLDDVDLKVLKKIIETGLKDMKKLVKSRDGWG